MNRSQIEVLAALHDLQPTTVDALNFYLHGKPDYGCNPLDQLLEQGLVTRHKWKPEPVVLTEQQRLGFDPSPQSKKGKRPYLYELAPHSADAAAAFNYGLRCVETALEGVIE